MLQPCNPSGPLAGESRGDAPFSYYPAIPAPRGISLTTLPEHPCAYLPGKIARSRAIWAERLPAQLYRELMDAGFRRSGKLIYQPVCAGCRACQPIRVPVKTFSPDKSQRRAWRNNQDITVTIAPPVADAENYALYTRYLHQWHGREPVEDSPENFERFLYDSPVPSLEFRYRDGLGNLLAVGICDVCADTLSSVYFYFDPRESRRSLGTFGAIYELDYAKADKLNYYYLGYWIEGCATMQYKSRFRPYELLTPAGIWTPGC
jgi:arginine-tRNA-protein transferase